MIKYKKLILGLILVISLATTAMAVAQSNSLAAGKNPDFDANGIVGYSDFFLFSNSYGQAAGPENNNNQFDLNDDKTINFTDFLLFISYFGKKVEPLKNYFKFTFQNWNPGEVKDLMDYLCGKDEWKANSEVYECTNMGNLDGAYKLALDIFGEPFEYIPSIEIIKDTSIKVDGYNEGNRIKLNNPLAIDHELLHSFRYSSWKNSSYSPVYEEGMVEAVSTIIRKKFGRNTSREQVISEYDSYNKAALRSKNNRFFINLQLIANMQYGVAAATWLEMYSYNKNFFKLFNSEFKKELAIYPTIGGDNNKIKDIVKKIMPTVGQASLDEWYDKNHILSEGKGEDIAPILYSLFDNIFFIFDRKNSTQPNTANFDVKLKIYNYQNKIIGEGIPTKERSFLGSQDVWNGRKIVDNFVKNQIGRYKVEVSAEKGIDKYTDFNWIAYTPYSGIKGVIVPYNDGTVTITPENREALVLKVINGAFGAFTKEEEASLRQLDGFFGPINIKFRSSTGKIITKTFYKIVPEPYIMLNDTPFIYHEKASWANEKTPLEIRARTYQTEETYVNYRYGNSGGFRQLKMTKTGNDFIAMIPNNRTDADFIEYYISASKEGVTTTYPDNGTQNPLKISVIKTSDKQALFSGKVKIIKHNLSSDALAGHKYSNGGGAFYIGNQLYELNLNQAIAPIILTLGRADIPASNGDMVLEYEMNGEQKEINIYYPQINSKKFNDWNDHFNLFIASDGSTYWQKNDDLEINNETFEDALRNGNLARKAP